MRSNRTTTRPRTWKLLVVLVAISALAVSAVATAGQKTRKTNGVIWAGITHLEGSNLYVSGDFKDKLLGRGAIVYVVNVEAGDPGSFLVKAKKITIYTKRGSLSGKGEATETPSPDGTSIVSDGSFKLKKGTGAYKGHKLKGTFDGVSEDGVYTFDYKGKYR